MDSGDSSWLYRNPYNYGPTNIDYSKPLTYEIPELVVKEVVTDVWTFSKPFTQMGFWPVGGRSTAIKLSTGNVWVLASTPLTGETRKIIDSLGPVKWIMAGDLMHHLYLTEYARAYPDAKVIGVKGLAEKKKKDGLVLAGCYGVDPEGTSYGFESEISACYFSGFIKKDVAFFHAASKTLVVADLLMNLPCNEQYSKAKGPTKIPVIGNLNPYSTAYQVMLGTLMTDKEAMRRDIAIVRGWHFERIIPCHGDVITTNAKKAWDTAYIKYLP